MNKTVIILKNGREIQSQITPLKIYKLIENTQDKFINVEGESINTNDIQSIQDKKISLGLNVLHG